MCVSWGGGVRQSGEAGRPPCTGGRVRRSGDAVLGGLCTGQARPVRPSCA